MGNTSSSKDRHGEDTVDFGALVPQGGIYPSAIQDWNQAVVAQLIVHRKLAPFYRPLEDYEDNWDDEQILAARKVVALPPSANSSTTGVDDPTGASAHGSSTPVNPASTNGGSQQPQQHHHHHLLHTPAPLQSASSALRHAAASGNSNNHKSAARSSNKEPQRNYEAQLYRGAVDCPICFMYYPPNTNQTRCCDQAICTECFVHIKRADPTTTHLVSEPVCCPYCMQPNFGVTYTPPSWRAGIGSDGGSSPRPDIFTHSSSGSSVSSNSIESGAAEGKRRRKSLSHTSQDVVTIDQIRPDWEQKLNAVRAAVARRANRRIVMRQVGDQLIPVGITSGRVIALPPGTNTEGSIVINEHAALGGPDAANSNGGMAGIIGGRSRRAGRFRSSNGAGGSGAGDTFGQFLGSMGMGGHDIEELMIMEAMRLSMVEENERIRRQQEQERTGPGGQGSSSTTQANTVSTSFNPPIPYPPLSSSHPNSVSILDHLRAPDMSQQSQLSSSLPNPNPLRRNASSDTGTERSSPSELSYSRSSVGSSMSASTLSAVSSSAGGDGTSTASNNGSSAGDPLSRSRLAFGVAPHEASPTLPISSCSALGGASASIAMAIGAPGATRNVRDASDANPDREGGVSALSAKLGSTLNVGTRGLAGGNGQDPAGSVLINTGGHAFPSEDKPGRSVSSTVPPESIAPLSSSEGANVLSSQTERTQHQHQLEDDGGLGTRTPLASPRSATPEPSHVQASSGHLGTRIPAFSRLTASPPSQSPSQGNATQLANFQSNPPLATTTSINSESVGEGYDWLSSSPHSSVLSDGLARERLIEHEDGENDDDGDESAERDDGARELVHELPLMTVQVETSDFARTPTLPLSSESSIS